MLYIMLTLPMPSGTEDISPWHSCFEQDVYLSDVFPSTRAHMTILQMEQRETGHITNAFQYRARQAQTYHNLLDDARQSPFGSHLNDDLFAPVSPAFLSSQR